MMEGYALSQETCHSSLLFHDVDLINYDKLSSFYKKEM